jgi:hypothetical protein
MSVLKAATSCWWQAAEAEKQAAQIINQHLKCCLSADCPAVVGVSPQL